MWKIIHLEFHLIKSLINVILVNVVKLDIIWNNSSGFEFFVNFVYILHQVDYNLKNDY